LATIFMQKTRFGGFFHGHKAAIACNSTGSS
jgi:hypothetical protein